jgi:hypothetical protein
MFLYIYYNILIYYIDEHNEYINIDIDIYDKKFKKFIFINESKLFII